VTLLRRRLGVGQGELAQMRAAASPGRTVIIQQARVDQLTRWNVTSALSAIDEHELGDFSRSGQLIDSMGRDDKMSSTLNTRVRAIVGANGLDFTIAPPEGEAETLAKRCSAWWFDFLPDAALTQISADMVMAGVHISRVYWGAVESEWRPVRTERWHTRNIRWDEDQQRFVVRTANDELVVEPGDPNWLVVSPGGSRSWMCGAVRALGLAYVMRAFIWRDWARFNERHGLPVIAITEPHGVDESKKKQFYDSVRRMGSTGFVRLPQSGINTGFGFDYKEAKDQAHATFQAFRKDLDIAISVCLLGQNLTSEATGGSLALGRVQDRVRADYLEADTEGLSTSLRAQILVPYCRFNVPGFRDAQAPWPTWNTSVPVDRAVEADTFGKIADAVKVFQSTGMPVDFAEVFTRAGVPMQKGKDPNTVEPPKPEPVPGLAAEPNARAKKPPAAAKQALRGFLAGETKAGFLQGQIYTDELVEKGTEKALLASREFINGVLKAIEKGRGWEEIRAAVLAYYDGAAPPEVVREILAQTYVLADLAGQAAVLEDAPDVEP
jgi:phage gp29-like protein